MFSFFSTLVQLDYTSASNQEKQILENLCDKEGSFVGDSKNIDFTCFRYFRNFNFYFMLLILKLLITNKGGIIKMVRG